MKTEIDPNSGFCFGVVNAITKAEAKLENETPLYCLGDIVHNNAEVERLTKRGLITIDHQQFKNLKNVKVLIRAHGEPPETYQIAQENEIQLIDASCPVVLKLQNSIKKGYEEAEKINGQIVIFGKKGHAEVNGLVGQTKGKAIVISNEADLHLIDYKRPVTIFSQTTKSPAEYEKIIATIRKNMQEATGNKTVQLTENNSICKQVSRRDNQLREFAKKHDVIIFVGGKKSSNAKVLFDICLQENSKSYFISEVNEIQAKWLQTSTSTGICGATSTPRWLMEEVAAHIEKI